MRTGIRVGATVGFFSLTSSLMFGAGQQPTQPGTQAQVASPCASHVRVPNSNRTSLGLYVSPQEAYAMWKADPRGVRILDVRTFEEYMFVGHAEGAQNVPLLFPRYDPAGPAVPGRLPGYAEDLNPDFVTQVKKAIGPDVAILVMCASGGRAARAVNVLATAGLTRVYNIIDGLEGEPVDDPSSAYFGKKMKNGWKNCGLPWTYALDPGLLWVAGKK